MEEGYIIISRKILDWEWYGIPEMVALWIHILFEANWEDKRWRGIVIPRGSFVTSISRLAKSSGLSVQQTRTCLERLKSTHEITIKSTNNYTIVTVCKYDVYQLTPGYYQQSEQQAEQQTDNKRVTNEQQQQNKDNKIINILATNAPAYMREDWRFVSSVRRTILGNDKDRIVEYKKEVFSKEVYALAEKVGMSQQQQEAFISWWTERSPGNEKIKAEFEVAFDMESRMRSWVERDRPRYQQQPQNLKSNIDRFEERQKFINEFFNHGNKQQYSAPDEQ